VKTIRLNAFRENASALSTLGADCAEFGAVALSDVAATTVE
jgi:hypothetical protein